MASGEKKKQMPISFPWIPGFDFAGTIVSSEQHLDFRPGARVFCKCAGSSYADYIVVESNKLAKIPEGYNMNQAAAAAHVGLTAWQALNTYGRLRKGQKILIHGAAGGVGGFAVQFAKHIGAYIYGTASAKNMEYIRSIGTDVAIDYKNEDFTVLVNGVDIVLDLVGRQTQIRSFDVLKPEGILITTTGLIHREPDVQKRVHAIYMVVSPNGEDMKNMVKAIESGRIVSEVTAQFPLRDAREAWNLFLGKSAVSPKTGRGKIVLLPG